MVKRNFLKISAILIGCTCIALVLTGALPGEMEGCEGGEGAKEVDYYKYCNDRCAINAHKESESQCDIFEGEYTESEIYEMCRISFSCDNPLDSICQPRCDEPIIQLCAEGTFFHPYISVSEANRCLNALEDLSCEHWGEIPPECDPVALCDPK
jgi:hypothetical protein